MKKVKWVKVKIAVVVDSEGLWASSGWGAAKDKGKLETHMILDAMYETLDDITSASDIQTVDKTYWITAEIPIPEMERPIEIEAKSVEEVT